MRLSICRLDSDDGFLLTADGDPACSCRCAPGGTNGSSDDPSVLSLSDFRTAPIYRHRGFVEKLLEGVVGEVQGNGVRAIEALAEHGETLDHLELWDDDIFSLAGFQLVHDDAEHAVLRREL